MQKYPHFLKTITIVFIYFLGSTLFSIITNNSISKSPELTGFSSWHTIKDFIFIIITSFVLFFLIKRVLKNQRNYLTKNDFQSQQIQKLNKEYQEINQQLVTRNKFIETILYKLPIGIAVNRISDGSATFLNKKFEEIYGWPSNEIKAVDDFFEKVYPNPAYRQGIMEQVLADINSMDAERMHWHGLTTTAKDGSNKIIDAFNIPLFDQDQMISTVVDITEKTKIEQRVKESEEKYRQLIEIAPFAIAVIQNFKIVFINKTGFDLLAATEFSEIIGLDINRFIHETSGQLFKDWVDKLNYDKNALPLETKCVRFDGTIIDVEISAAVLNYNDKPAFQVVLQDITAKKKSTEQLKENSKILQWFFDLPFIGMVIFSNTSDKWIRFNNQLCEILGYTRNEFNRLTWKDITHIEDLKDEQMEMNKIIEGRIDSFKMDKRYIRKDGKIIYASTDVKCIRNEQGEIENFVATIQDITDRINTVKDLQQSEERFSNIFNLSPIGICLINLASHKYVECNPAFLKQTGYSRKEIIGYSPDTLVFQNDSVEIADIATYYLTNKTFSNTEFQLKHKDGSYSYFLISAATIVISSHKYLMLLLSDITDRKMVEIALQTSESKYRALVEQSLTGIYIFDEHGFIYVNKRFEELFGYTLDELITSVSPTDLLMDDDKSTTEEYIRLQITGEFESVQYTAKGKRKDNSLIWIEVHGSYVNMDGKNAITGTILDITERINSELEIKKYQEHLEELVKERTSELEAFSYSVSHDLKAPLRAIEGFSNIILEDFSHKLEEEVKNLLRVIVANTNKMRQLIDDILLLSKIGMKEIRSNKIDLNKLVNSIIQEQTQFEQKIIWKIQDLPSILADENLFKQLFINLISNAVKFSQLEPNPEIEIGYKHQTKVFFIWDNGIGIDKKHEESIFEPFHRLHTDAEFEGTGIGLSIVKRIIKKHQGQIWVDSLVTKGVSFEFTIGENFYPPSV